MSKPKLNSNPNPNPDPKPNPNPKGDKNKVSLADVKDETAPSSNPSRIYRSAFAATHEGQEPVATNWSWDFKE
jgi:hypothetical protein